MAINSQSTPQPLTQSTDQKSITPATPEQKMNTINPYIFILLGTLLLGIGGIGGYFLANKQITTPASRACTLEAKICPDGSSVGRTGPNCEFAPCPAQQPTTIPAQILPTKPISTINPTLKPVIITPIDTSDWKNVENNGINFKIPANASCDNNTVCKEVTYPNIYQGKIMPLPARILIKITDYLGGSRRDQFFTSQPGDQECKPIFVETKFGSVDALQIATDGGWCQGGYSGSIVTVVGKKFVIIGPGLNYNDNKEISRWDVRDTLVSTLRSK
jgi:hypothetical protein